MESPITHLRLTSAMCAEAKRRAAAAGITVSEWIRGLIERETGIKAEMKEGGAAHASKKRRREIAAAGGRAKAANAKVKS